MADLGMRRSYGRREAIVRRAVSPSSDCTKAHSRAEHLICTDPELSALDVQLAALYKRAKATAAD
jgi:uncharacterized protein